MTIYTRVGKFHVSNGFGKVLCRGSTYSYYNIKLFILVIIIVSSILLIMAGDVELNLLYGELVVCQGCVNIDSTA